MTRVTVLDFGLGNLRSVAKALERAGADVTVSEEVDASADGLVVPGQGHFGSCVVNLGARLDQVRAWIEAGRPYFGICLGLQVLFERSEESPEAGMSLFEGAVVRFASGLKVPHIGWNEIVPAEKAAMFDGVDAGTRFYFVHSYFPAPADSSVVSATADYGGAFCAAVERDNVMATQFHPEKSGDAGARVLRNFIDSCA